MTNSTTLKSLKNHIGLALTTYTLLGLAMSTPAAAASKYSITDLGAGSSTTYSAAYGINDNGQVVGLGIFSNINNTGPNAFVWDKTNGIQPLQPLPSLFARSQANGINNQGQVVGYVFNDVGGSEAVVWDRNKHPQGLGWLNSNYRHPESSGYGINDKGQVVGVSSSYSANGIFSASAFEWDSKNGIQTVDDLGSGSLAKGINNLGQVVGSNGTGDAFVYDSTNGIRQNLPSLGGSSVANAINNQGQVVGSSGGHAFEWDRTHGIQDLGTLKGQSDSVANGINNQGQVVGSSGGHAFVWSNGVIRDLNNLIEPGFGGILTGAQAINSEGQIAANASINGTTHAILLTPVP